MAAKVALRQKYLEALRALEEKEKEIQESEQEETSDAPSSEEEPAKVEPASQFEVPDFKLPRLAGKKAAEEPKKSTKKVVKKVEPVEEEPTLGEEEEEVEVEVEPEPPKKAAPKKSAAKTVRKDSAAFQNIKAITEERADDEQKEKTKRETPRRSETAGVIVLDPESENPLVQELIHYFLYISCAVRKTRIIAYQGVKYDVSYTKKFDELYRKVKEDRKDAAKLALQTGVKLEPKAVPQTPRKVPVLVDYENKEDESVRHSAPPKRANNVFSYDDLFD
jgi:hypothetical protein